ncbi:hypothetical protein [Azohydromonas caseinilytica]|uniref:Uncharacterized protein n=1 Tax=Azohydromonas caseinilytica TaxID=2728836 RepID=A0A848F788_9BURK|nr:hypothetical protein [Azohydromonas caseinilytica]NML14120.1 hypothetical protein [Azohydromonas caseinilytica]
MDIPPLEPPCAAAACRPLLAALVTLLAATSAVAQSRDRLSTTTYALSSTTVPSQGDTSEHSQVELVRWAPAGHGSWGMALGASRDGTHSAVQPEVGLRWRSRVEGNQRLDLSAWRRLNTSLGDAGPGQAEDPVTLRTRIELQFIAPRSSASLSELGAVGLQLGSDSKLSMRIRRGGPMVYYRMQF